MKYKIVKGSSTQELAYHVNLHTFEGWYPTGNVFTEVKEEMFWNEWQIVTYFAQPMIKDCE